MHGSAKPLMSVRVWLHTRLMILKYKKCNNTMDFSIFLNILFKNQFVCLFGMYAPEFFFIFMLSFLIIISFFKNSIENLQGYFLLVVFCTLYLAFDKYSIDTLELINENVALWRHLAAIELLDLQFGYIYNYVYGNVITKDYADLLEEQITNHLLLQQEHKKEMDFWKRLLWEYRCKEYNLNDNQIRILNNLLERSNFKLGLKQLRELDQSSSLIYQTLLHVIEFDSSYKFLKGQETFAQLVAREYLLPQWEQVSYRNSSLLLPWEDLFFFYTFNFYEQKRLMGDSYIPGVTVLEFVTDEELYELFLNRDFIFWSPTSISFDFSAATWN